MVFLESNRGKSDTNKWLALSHIMGGLDISGEMAQTTTQNKPITLSSNNISQTTSDRAKNAIRET